MKKNNLIKGRIRPFHPCKDVKRSIPDSIPEIQSFILRKREELRNLRADPNEDTSPYNPSQMNSVVIRYAESKMGRLLKESGADKDDWLLPRGIDREECDFWIKCSQYDQFIEQALISVVVLNKEVAKWKFFKIGPNGSKILEQLINKEIVKEFTSTCVRLKHNRDINIADVRNIAGADFDKVWSVFQQTNAIVTWGDVLEEAFLSGE